MTTRTNAPRTGRRRAATLGVLAVTLAPMMTACSHGSTSHPSSHGTSSATPSPTATPTPGLAQKATTLKTVPVPVAVRRQAKSGTQDYLGATATILSNPKARSKPSSDAITGSALASLLAQRTEYDTNDYRVVGRATVVRQRVVRKLTNPTRLIVLACVDNSRVRVVDKKGDVLPNSAGPKRSLNLLTLVERGSHWVVSASGFPDDASC